MSLPPRPDWFSGKLLEPSRWTSLRVPNSVADEWLANLVPLLTQAEYGFLPFWMELVSRHEPLLHAVTHRNWAGLNRGVWSKSLTMLAA